MLESELSKKCDELRHLFILQQRGRKAGSGGSSTNSGTAGSAHSNSGDSNNLMYSTFYSSSEIDNKSQSISELRHKFYGNPGESASGKNLM